MKICNEAYIVFVALVVCSAVVFGPIVLFYYGALDCSWYYAFAPLGVCSAISGGMIYSMIRGKI